MPTLKTNSKSKTHILSVGSLAAVLLLTPMSALAQEVATSSAAATEAAAAEAAAAEAAAAEAAAAEKAAAEKAAADQAAAEAAAKKAADDSAAAAATETAQESATTTTEGKTDGKDGKDKDALKGKNMMAQMAVTGAPPAGAKPWRLQATIEATLGAGAFVGGSGEVAPTADPTLSIDGGGGTAAFGYNVRLRGFWTFNDYVTGLLGVDFNQQLSKSNTDLGVSPNEFFFGDLRLGAISPTFYSWELTGINFGGFFGVRLPTSKMSQGIERVLRTDLALNAFRSWTDVGPGTLTWTILSGSVRKDFGSQQVTLDEGENPSYVASCRSVNAADQAECLTDIMGVNWGLNYGTSLTYSFFGNFTASIGMSMTHQFFYDSADSSLDGVNLAAGENIVVGSSPFAIDQTPRGNFLEGTIELGYMFNQYFATRLGMTTFQNPWVQSGDNSTAPAFPFFDSTENASNNLTTFYLDLNFFL